MTDNKEERVLEEYRDFEVVKVADTSCEHYWVESERQDNNSDLLSINCIKCPIGASIDADKFIIKNGKITKRK
jgi:hypothetical protein